jgi:hypothetical protein
MLARTPEQRKPYRLDSRQALSSQPPFTPALVRELLVKALAGPKGRVAQIVIEEQAISKLVGTLNHRHAAFVAAQADRARAARRAHLIWLFAELRKALPEVIRDIEEQKLKVGDFFACATEKAITKLGEVILFSDTIEKALPALTLDQISGYGWRLRSLHADVSALLGATASIRFLVSVIPKLSGETPAFATVKAHLLKDEVG